MATQYTDKLGLALPVQGELTGSWGDVINGQITSLLETAVAGIATINTWAANSHTLTVANGAPAESRAAILSLTDTGVALSGAGTVICPAESKIYFVRNSTAQAITIKPSAGTGVVVQSGFTGIVFCDGVNVVDAVNPIFFDNTTSGLSATNLQSALDELDGLVNTNTTNIATNTSNIATNTSNIATNTSNIATNTSGTSTNTTNIATNTSNIATNTGVISSLGTAAYEDITTSSTDTTVGRVLTQGSVGFEYQRHIKTTKGFTSSGVVTAEVLYLGTIKSGTHTIQFSTRGNSGFNTYEINLEMTFSNSGTDGVSPHGGVRATSKIKGFGADEFLGFSTIKVNGSTAAVYLLYQDLSQIHGVYAGYNSFTADTIGVSPYATETWTPLSVSTAISGSNDIPTLLYMDSTSLSYNGNEVLTDGNTNLNEFGGLVNGDYIAHGFALTSTFGCILLPISSTTAPTSVTITGGFNVVRFSSNVLATNPTLTLNAISSNKLAILLFETTGLVEGTSFNLMQTSNASKITVNF